MNATSESAFQRHFSQGSGTADTNDTMADSQAHAEEPTSSPAQATPSSTSAQHAEMSKRLELLERRIMAPPQHQVTRKSSAGDSSLGMDSISIGNGNGNGNSRPMNYVTQAGRTAATSPLPLGVSDDMAEVLYHHQNSGSHHSFTFAQSGTGKGKGTPSKSSRSNSLEKKRRSSTASPSTQVLENAAEMHIKKVSRTLAAMPQDTSSRSAGASAPYPPFSDARSPASASATNTNRSHSMSSNQTLITAHVNANAKHRNQSDQVIVAESPPISNEEHNKPGSFARNGATPRVARTILGESSSSSGKKAVTPSGNKRKSSVPTRLPEKRKQRNLRFNQERATSASVSSPPPAARQGNGNGHGNNTGPITPVISSTAVPHIAMEHMSSSLSRGSSNPARVTVKNTITSIQGTGAATSATATASASAIAAGVGTQKPPANMLITKFFSMPQNGKKKDAKPAPTCTSSNDESTNRNQQPVLDNHNNAHLLKEITDLKANITSLNESLNEKASQLKAVSNNQTIIHSQLKKALHQRQEEINSLMEDIEKKNAKTCDALEALIRKDSARGQAELRQKLASDGGRLGRWIYSRVGMRMEPIWEDGSMLKACKKKRAELKMKRDVLETRLRVGFKSFGDVSGNKEGVDAMEREEFEQSITVHLDELERAERELQQEEDSLYKEKNSHKMALKQVASEDGSRFQSRPKVSLFG